MKSIEKIVTNPILIGIIMLKDFVEIFRQVRMGDSIFINNGFDWFDFIVKLVIATSLWLLLRAYFKLKHEFEVKMRVFTIISEVRAKLQFLKLYENRVFSQLPHESDEDFKNRTPDGLYNAHYTNEYNIVKNELQKELSRLTVPEIDKLLLKFYRE